MTSPITVDATDILFFLMIVFLGLITRELHYISSMLANGALRGPQGLPGLQGDKGDKGRLSASHSPNY